MEELVEWMEEAVSIDPPEWTTTPRVRRKSGSSRPMTSTGARYATLWLQGLGTPPEPRSP